MMDFPAPATEDPSDPDAIIVKADEVDEAGADISAISPSNTVSESDFNARIENRRAADAQTSGSPKILANALPSPARPIPRPILRRDGSAPAPPTQPPPPAPPRAEPERPTDSLSLQQLKRLVGELPKLEPAAYDYHYSETRSFPEELQEWFVYSEEERLMLLRAREDFEEKWGETLAGPGSPNEEISWIDAQDSDREKLIKESMEALQEDDISERVKGLESLSYVALGAWGETVGLVKSEKEDEKNKLASQGEEDEHVRIHPCHLEWIKKGVRLLLGCRAPRLIVKVLQDLWESEQKYAEPPDLSEEALAEFKLMQQLEGNHALTILYVIVEVGRSFVDEPLHHDVRTTLEYQNPSLLLLLTQILARTRWDDSLDPSCMPRTKLLLLFWKSLLLLFGTCSDVQDSKGALRKMTDANNEEDNELLITASPLDYHLFRQEITSKYPAYTPPPPLIPLEPENNTVLPPLPHHASRQSSHNESNDASSGNGIGGSIFNKPVHIATPAPSPPPSPAGPGGKAAKKQNYQTNQNFPFLYPPLDQVNHKVSAKEAAHLQNADVNKRWGGDDVPASIREAGQLFASRMRMSRSLRQLWDVRERYIKEERGWGEDNGQSQEEDDDEHDDSDDANNDEDDDSLLDSPECVEKKQLPKRSRSVDGISRLPETNDREVQRRLDGIDEYYRGALPDLQSLIIVLWKEMFTIVSALVATNGPNAGTADENSDPVAKRKTNANSSASLNALANGHVSEHEDIGELPAEDLNDVRTRELCTKAVSGILLIMLKWFKLSHVLKFEYLTQLLLDANYLPLVLKYFAHQNVDKAVEQRNDRQELDFLTFCHHHSKHPPTSPQPTLSHSSDSDSSDEAAPPPIRKHRHSLTLDLSPSTPPPPPASKLPEVDELGFPTAGSVLPKTPLKNFAPRFFLINVNLLRLLQKITKRKAHRALLMVQYKSSTILRKALKIPQPELRLYTLKLFKSQVPYCGRKWRQTNMRVITAIYLHCRPELRDEWLCGGDVDGVVEEAVPVEQAARSLVHWWHLREYRESMEGNMVIGKEKEEYDFFARELEKMGWGAGDVGSADGEPGEAAGDGGGGPEFEEGQGKIEGWH